MARPTYKEGIYKKNGDLVLLYDSRIKGKPRKLETTWLGPYFVEDIRSKGVVQL
jgi:hypothetical protein